MSHTRSGFRRQSPLRGRCREAGRSRRNIIGLGDEPHSTLVGDNNRAERNAEQLGNEKCALEDRTNVSAA